MIQAWHLIPFEIVWAVEFAVGLFLFRKHSSAVESGQLKISERMASFVVEL